MFRSYAAWKKVFVNNDTRTEWSIFQTFHREFPSVKTSYARLETCANIRLCEPPAENTVVVPFTFKTIKGPDRLCWHNFWHNLEKRA